MYKRLCVPTVLSVQVLCTSRCTVHNIKMHNGTIFLHDHLGFIFFCKLKGGVSRDFRPSFFHHSNPSRPLKHRQTYFRIWTRFRRDIRSQSCLHGMLHIVEIVSAYVAQRGDKFMIEYPGEFETEFENTLACLSGAQVELNHEKT